MLCVGDRDGLSALTTLLQHHSDTTTQTLAASRIPIGPVLHAPRKDWYADYGPQALLAFAATLTPSDYTALTDALRRHAGAALPALHSAFPQHAARILAAPHSTDLHSGGYWHWQGNGWAEHPVTPDLIWLIPGENGLIPQTAAPANAPSLVLPLFAWERAAGDNVPTH